MSDKEETKNNEEKNNEGEEEEEESSEFDYELNTLDIKKEQLTNITLNINDYNYLIEQLSIYAKLFQKIKQEKYPNTFSKEIQTIEKKEDFDSELEKKNLEGKISSLENENNTLKGRIIILKEENDKLKEEIKKNENTSNEKIESLNKIVLDLKKELEILKSTNLKLTNDISHMRLISPFEEVFKSEKNIDRILSYLPKDYSFSLTSINKTVHNDFYYKFKCKYLEKKIKQKQEIITQLTTEDLAKTLEIDNEDMYDLIKKYTQKHVIPGNKLRYILTHSLLFIENIIRKPLREKHDENINPKTKNFLKGFLSIIKNDENEINKYLNEQNYMNELNSKMIAFPKDEIVNLNDYDKSVLEALNGDKTINIKFEFNTSEEIKVLIGYFLKAKLDKENYTKFMQYFIDEFAELLFNCFESLKELKELDIVNLALNARIKRYGFLMKEMQYDIENLSQYANSSKEVKENLTKLKNDIEVKYNGSLMQISQLIKEKNDLIMKDEENKKLNELKDKEFEEFKGKILNEYKNVEKNYNFTVKERDLLKNAMIDFRNYLMNFVNEKGEIV